MKFRKKPVVIEAFQYTEEWAAQKMKASYDRWLECHGDYAIIHTLEGDMRASIGDWIITGVKGEHYPCKPDIFAATYEKVAGEPEDT